MKTYNLLKDHENYDVMPDKEDLEYYKGGVLTWEGFKINYLTKLMKPEAIEWMERVSLEAENEEVVLVDDEEEPEYSYRVLLANRMMNMFVGHLKLNYAGELINN